MDILRKCRTRAWLIGLLIGWAFLAADAGRGEFDFIWQMAARLGLECIGIG